MTEDRFEQIMENAGDSIEKGVENVADKFDKSINKAWRHRPCLLYTSRSKHIC